MNFPYDVFLSHSPKDKAIFLGIAERLKKDGIKLWFDDLEIRPGDNIPAKIKAGVKDSGVLVPRQSAGN